MAAIAQLLARDDVRLVTLTGPGGTGKTRLAMEIGAEILDRYPDGVFFVDLSSLTDPSLVVSTIAAAYGVREIVGQPLLETLSGFLVDKRLLLLLDHCEQVLAAVPPIAALLAVSPTVSILATSREPLHIRAEREIAVAPLLLPGPVRQPALAEFAGVAAVTLFVERAQAAHASFALGSDMQRLAAAQQAGRALNVEAAIAAAQAVAAASQSSP